MKLLTKEIEARIPALYSQEKNPDPMIVVKFFNPGGAGTWYVFEGAREGDDFVFFGYVTGLGEDEKGFFSLNELSSVRTRFGLGIERDLWWTPAPLSTVRK